MLREQLKKIMINAVQTKKELGTQLRFTLQLFLDAQPVDLVQSEYSAILLVFHSVYRTRNFNHREVGWTVSIHSPIWVPVCLQRTYTLSPCVSNSRISSENSP